ncbi:MAG TPA: hypothetical protein VFG83_16885 [Kofleriaceae bacterium]|nr:hypothetical protein [Kofleriaceae bacterium]
MERRDSNALPQLVREVELPPQPVSGLGIMVVASMAMLFAVVSSAFILRTRMSVEQCPHHHMVNAAMDHTAAPGTAQCAHVVYVDVETPICVPEETMIDLNLQQAPSDPLAGVDYMTK